MKMDIHQVNSKETVLSPDDVVLVAAHMADPAPYEASAKEHGISAERLIHTIYVQLMQNPGLLLIREGNTLFPTAALEDRIGYVTVYNGDVDENIVENFHLFLQAAHKMGFNVLCIKDETDCIKDALDKSSKEFTEAEFGYDDKNDLLVAVFNQPHKD
jgi:hypothetical protein